MVESAIRRDLNPQALNRIKCRVARPVLQSSSSKWNRMESCKAAHLPFLEVQVRRVASGATISHPAHRQHRSGRPRLKLARLDSFLMATDSDKSEAMAVGVDPHAVTKFSFSRKVALGNWIEWGFLSLLTLVFVILLVYTHIKWRRRVAVDRLVDVEEATRRQEWRTRRAASLLAHSILAEPNIGGLSLQVSDSALESLPSFLFAKDDSLQDDARCAICLEQFQEGGRCRLLPDCQHSFHVECIDTWLTSHSSCPLCRRTVVLPTLTSISTYAGGSGGTPDIIDTQEIVPEAVDLEADVTQTLEETPATMVPLAVHIERRSIGATNCLQIHAWISLKALTSKVTGANERRH